MIAGFILEFILLLVSLGLITASAAEKSWNMAMIAYVLCAVRPQSFQLYGLQR